MLCVLRRTCCVLCEATALLANALQREFMEDMANLGVRMPDVLTRVSEYIPEVSALCVLKCLLIVCVCVLCVCVFVCVCACVCLRCVVCTCMQVSY